MVEHGFYNFLNWFDERAWYPLGRIVGGTVRLKSSFNNAQCYVLLAFASTYVYVVIDMC